MLYECRHTINDEGPYKLRWFHSSFFDLDVWLAPDGSIHSFLLSYNKPRDEHAIAWSTGSGFLHHKVDDGEGRPGKHKSSPLLLANGDVDVPHLAERFRQESRDISPTIADFILRTILTLPKPPPRPEMRF